MAAASWALLFVPVGAVIAVFARPLLRFCLRFVKRKKEKDALDLPLHRGASMVPESITFNNGNYAAGGGMRQRHRSSAASWQHTAVGANDLAAGVEMLHPNFRKLFHHRYVAAEPQNADPPKMYQASPLQNQGKTAPSPIPAPAPAHTITDSSREARVPSHRGSVFELEYAEIEFITLVGEGGFGKVYKALWKGAEVAAKILTCNVMSADLLNEFRNEINVMSSLRHPNVCMFLGAVTIQHYCIITEFCAHGSLWAVLHGNTRVVDWNMLLHWVRGIVLGFVYLHGNKPQPILHRDLKSGNVLIDSSWNAKLADFGMSRLKSHTQTMTGGTGTMQWMAPEVLAAQRYTEKADVYSFSICVWEIEMARLGQPSVPYKGISQIQAAVQVLQHNARPRIPQGAARQVAELCASCWQKDAASRPSFDHILKHASLLQRVKP